jgi:8-oxo-dGTP pyrophosphatase MutT (NUDIX family)
MSEWVPTETQVSAGGVVFRLEGSQVWVVLISVGEARRWQLPKGLVNAGETHEEAAQREVREETGLTTELLGPLDKVDYWFLAQKNGQRVRFHKFVHFFLMRCISGSVEDHDFEVNEARWVEIEKTLQMLTFESDRRIMTMAAEKIAAMG